MRHIITSLFVAVLFTACGTTPSTDSQYDGPFSKIDYALECVHIGKTFDSIDYIGYAPENTFSVMEDTDAFANRLHRIDRTYPASDKPAGVIVFYFSDTTAKAIKEHCSANPLVIGIMDNGTQLNIKVR